MLALAHYLLAITRQQMVKGAAVAAKFESWAA